MTHIKFSWRHMALVPVPLYSRKPRGNPTPAGRAGRTEAAKPAAQRTPGPEAALEPLSPRTGGITLAIAHNDARHFARATNRTGVKYQPSARILLLLLYRKL